LFVRERKDSYEIEHSIVKKSTGEVRVVHERCEHFLMNPAGSSDQLEWCTTSRSANGPRPRCCGRRAPHDQVEERNK
jgi:hypothetical protein